MVGKDLAETELRLVGGLCLRRCGACDFDFQNSVLSFSGGNKPYIFFIIPFFGRFVNIFAKKIRYVIILLYISRKIMYNNVICNV